MDETLIKPLMDLVGINTVRYNQEGYNQAAEFIAKLIEREIPEATVDIVRVESNFRGKHREVPNILAYIDAGAEKTVAFVSHYDVVDAEEKRVLKVDDMEIEIDPFKPLLRGNRLYGRGTADDKSAVIASIFAVKRALNDLKKNVLLVICGDEEIGGEAGIMAVSDRVLDLADEVLVIDGFYGRIANGASGVVAAEIKVRGEPGHAAYGFNYKNSAHALINLLHTLIHSFQVNLFGSYSEIPASYAFNNVANRLSVTYLSAGGESTNIIPENATARIDYRYIDNDVKAAEDRLVRAVKAAAIANGLDPKDVIVRILGNHPSRYVPKEHPFVKKFKEIAESVTGDEHVVGAERGGNDGFVFARAGIPTITYGAMMEDSNIHGRLENLRLDIFMKLVGVLEAYLKEV